MSSDLEQFVVNTADKAKKGVEGAKRHTGAPSTFTKQKRGKITVANGNGTYQVSVMGNDNTAVDTIDGVVPWGDGVSFDSGDKVWLVWTDQRPIPYIFTSGSGSSGGNSGADTLIVAKRTWFS